MMNKIKVSKCTRSILTIAFIIFGLCSLQSCKAFNIAKLLKSEKSYIYKLSNGSREIIFIGMIHIGKKVFYEDEYVKQKVIAYKKKGYSLFYEYIKEDKNLDDIHITI